MVTTQRNNNSLDTAYPSADAFKKFVIFKKIVQVDKTASISKPLNTIFSSFKIPSSFNQNLNGNSVD